MKYSHLIILILFALFSCSSPEPEKESAEEVKTEVPEISLSDEDLIKRYDMFVMSIDSTKAENISLATNKFKEMFDQSAPEVCDKAYVSFEKFYLKVQNGLENELEENGMRWEIECETYDENEKRVPFNKNYQKFLDHIAEYGFRLGCDEGTPFVEMERRFVKDNFYSYVTPVMKTYLVQLDKENNEWFSHDAGIIISEKEFVERAVFWEKFAKENPKFLFIDEAKYRQRNYLTFMLIGMDNTPVFSNSTGDDYLSFETVEDLDPYFSDAYTYLNEKYPKSEANKLVAPYFVAAKEQDAAKLTKLLKSNLRQGKLIDFESEYASSY